MTSNNNDQGVTRVAELENILGEIVDYYDQEELYITSDISKDYSCIEDIFERARTVLQREDQDSE